MSEYSNDRFEQEEANEKRHKMKLSIDFLSVKDLRSAMNLLVVYNLKTTSSSSQQFKSARATPVGINIEVKLNHSFAAYEFLASKSELLDLLSFTSSTLEAQFLHKEGPNSASSPEIEIGQVQVQLKELLQAPIR